MKLPLTAAQSGIWWGQALDPDSTAYWAAEYVELRGPLDFAAFERAVARAIDETEALQQRYFESGGQLWQERVAPEGFELQRVVTTDASGYMQRDLETPVDLLGSRPFATALLRAEAELHYWYLRAHHVALDGYGFHLLQRRVLERYDGATPAAHRATLRDLVREDQAYRASRSFARDREFWLNALQAQPEPSTLVAASALSRKVLRERTTLPAETHQALQTAARALGVDVQSWLCAAVAAFVHARTGSLQQTLGVPMAARLGSVAAALPCMMMNIVALPLTFEAGESFAELARVAARARRAAQPHQRYRYEDLKRDLGGTAAGRRLFGPIVNYMPFEPLPSRLARKQPLAAGPVEDLAVTLAPVGLGDECRLDLEANPHAYAAAELQEFRHELIELFERLVRAPQTTLAELREQARPRARLSLLDGGPLTLRAPLLTAIGEIAERAPERIALEQAGERVSYAELARRVRVLAGRLRARGVTEGSLVALVLPRSAQAVVAQLAVLWVGAAYVPFDPSGPAQRNREVLEHARPTFVVTPAWLLAEEPAAALEEPVPVASDALAYVIYTSGTTGRPNGVAIERQALEHFVAAAAERYAMTARDRVLQFAPLHFDASVEEIMVTLAVGATLVLRTDAMLDSLPDFLRACREQSISVLDLPTAFFHELARGLDDPRLLPTGLRLLIIGGEAALGERVARFLELAPATVTLLNSYGPTETTVVCSTAALRAGDTSVPIGVPLAGVTLAVVDEQLRLVRRGKPGQLCVMGPTLARGYQLNPEATAQRFVRLVDLPGAPRAYTTGDRVVLSESRQLVYLGRLDDELKLSGHRVNPLEVEQALLGQRGVEAAAVVVSGSAEKRLTAYVACAGELEVEELRRGLADRLPPPAIPAHFVVLSSLPLDANGKIDRRSLRAASPPETQPEAFDLKPLERIVLDVWREVLGRHVSSLDADFFALGGSSLSALQVSIGLQRCLGRAVPLSALFRHSSIRSLSRALERRAPDGGDYEGQDPLAPLLMLQSGRGTPLFCIHPADGLGWCYLGLSRELPHATLLALQAPGLTGAVPEGFERLVEAYLVLVRQAQPRGPYHLLGWSSGGGIAHALACRFRASGESVALVAMLDAYPADIWEDQPEPTLEDALVAMLDDVNASAIAPDGRRYAASELFARLKGPESSLARFDEATLRRMAEVSLRSMQHYRTARHHVLDGDVLFFRAARMPDNAARPEAWAPYVSGELRVVDVDATHLAMCQAETLAEIGPWLRAVLEPSGANLALASIAPAKSDA